MARLPRDAVSLWKPMARRVFPDLGYKYQSMKGSKAYLRNQAEYTDEKHHKNPQPARWDHRGNLEYDHADMSANGLSETKQTEPRNARYRGKQYTLRSEERENMKCMRSLPNRAEQCVCENGRINGGD